MLVSTIPRGVSTWRGIPTFTETTRMLMLFRAIPAQIERRQRGGRKWHAKQVRQSRRNTSHIDLTEIHALPDTRPRNEKRSEQIRIIGRIAMCPTRRHLR